MIKKYISPFLVILFMLLGSQAASSQSSPRSQLESIINEMISVLSDSSLKGPEHTEERRKKVIEVIEKGFDFGEMTKRSLGKHWKKLSKDEQEEITKLFARLIENSYITKIEGYSDEKVAFLKDRIKGKYAEINTEILSGSVSIPIKYRLKQKDNVWRVYDINIEGVSLLKNYRGQFNAIFKKGAYQELKRQLEKKVKDIEEEIKTKSS